MEDMNILAFFLSYPSLPIDASDEASEEAIKRGDEFRTYIWGEMGIDVLLKSLSYIDYGKDLKRILFQFHIMPCDYERIHIKEIEQYRKKRKSNRNTYYCRTLFFFSFQKQREENFLYLQCSQNLTYWEMLSKTRNLTPT